MATSTTLINKNTVFLVLDTGKFYKLTNSYTRYCNNGTCSCGSPQLTELPTN